MYCETDTDMQTHSIEKAKRSKEAEMKANEKKSLVDKINRLTKIKKHVDDELQETELDLERLLDRKSAATEPAGAPAPKRSRN